MPRPKKEGAPEPKKRSRHGCWPCKNRKIKCGEEKPQCLNCERQGEPCDYSIRLNWDVRTKKKGDDAASGAWSVSNGTHTSVSPAAFQRSSSQNSGGSPIELAPASPYMSSIPPKQDHHRQSSGSFLQSQRQSFQSPRNHYLYPSPSASTIDSPSAAANTGQSAPSLDRSQLTSAPMLPPQDFMFNRQFQDQNLDSFDHRNKRRRLSPVNNTYDESLMVFSGAVPSAGTISPLRETRPTASSIGPFGFPLTPGSEDGVHRSGFKQSPSIQSSSLDSRRLSVKSLLSNGPDEEDTTAFQQTVQSPIMHGFDQGLPDLDIPHNDDANALTILSPATKYQYMSKVGQDDNEPSSYGEFGFGLLAKDLQFEQGGYYSQPVPVKIPPYLMPLPSRLCDSPMNLLYFHHFLNHTARILVPHDCPDNPFRKILPQLALSNENLLNLLLAYSASHRARLLNHREPANRIAHWVRDVFPRLRHALDDTREHISDANLATAIMLASLEIISPNAFGVAISWQKHLTIARQMIIARGGVRSLHRHDKVSYFLSRWFAYLDVVGNLSGSNYDRPNTSYWLYDDSPSSDSSDGSGPDYEIDCLLGFTSHCVTILAKVADLAKRCDMQRIDADGSIRPDWRPSPEVVLAAERLKRDLQEARSHVPKGCSYRQRGASLSAAYSTASSDATEASGAIDASHDNAELIASNNAFHWAGLIHLSRRVLGKPPQDPEVQHAVREVLASVDKVRPGGTAEACLVLPMFTAGCEALDAVQRAKVLERIRTVEGCGMTQVHKARTLMERVWATGRPWETLVAGEFCG